MRESKVQPLPADVPVEEDPLAPITRPAGRLLRAKLLRILRGQKDDWAASRAMRQHLQQCADDAIVVGAPIGGVPAILRTYGMPKQEMAAPAADWQHAVRVVAGQFEGISAEQAVTRAVETLPSVLSKRELRQAGGPVGEIPAVRERRAAKPSHGPARAAISPVSALNASVVVQLLLRTRRLGTIGTARLTTFLGR